MTPYMMSSLWCYSLACSLHLFQRPTARMSGHSYSAAYLLTPFFVLFLPFYGKPHGLLLLWGQLRPRHGFSDDFPLLSTHLVEPPQTPTTINLLTARPSRWYNFRNKTPCLGNLIAYSERPICGIRFEETSAYYRRISDTELDA